MIDKNTILERLKFFINHCFNSAAELSRIMGISHQALQYLTSVTPSHKTLMRFEKIGLNPKWVLYGDGGTANMFAENEAGNELKAKYGDLLIYEMDFTPIPENQQLERWQIGIEEDIESLKQQLTIHEYRIKKLEDKK